MPVLPGILPLSITRGIAFQERILRCADDSVAVTGTLSPNVVGTFVLSGTFGGYDLYILPGAPSTFCYFNATATSYVIARLLTTGALTDYWTPAAPITVPTGTYVQHGANTGTATADDHTVDLTGFTAQAQVRRTAEATDITIDLNPSVTDPTNGEITIPGISSDDTHYDFTGTFYWDLVLASGGERVGVFVKGPFVVSDNITQT